MPKSQVSKSQPLSCILHALSSASNFPTKASEILLFWARLSASVLFSITFCSKPRTQKNPKPPFGAERGRRVGAPSGGFGWLGCGRGVRYHRLPQDEVSEEKPKCKLKLDGLHYCIGRAGSVERKQVSHSKSTTSHRDAI